MVREHHGTILRAIRRPRVLRRGSRRIGNFELARRVRNVVHARVDPLFPSYRPPSVHSSFPLRLALYPLSLSLSRMKEYNSAPEITMETWIIPLGRARYRILRSFITTGLYPKLRDAADTA